MFYKNVYKMAIEFKIRFIVNVPLLLKSFRDLVSCVFMCYRINVLLNASLLFIIVKALIFPSRQCKHSTSSSVSVELLQILIFKSLFSIKFILFWIFIHKYFIHSIYFKYLLCKYSCIKNKHSFYFKYLFIH